MVNECFILEQVQSYKPMYYISYLCFTFYIVLVLFNKIKSWKKNME